MELTACKWVLAIYLNAFSDLTWPQKKAALSCLRRHVHLRVCKQASFPRAAARAMERIPWLAAAGKAAGKHRPEPLAAPARPVRRRDKVQHPVVSQLGSQQGLPLFTLGEDGGMQGRRRRESLCHVLPTARHPAAAPLVMISAAAGRGLVSGDVSCRSRWDSQARTPDPRTKQQEKSVLFPGW